MSDRRRAAQPPGLYIGPWQEYVMYRTQASRSAQTASESAMYRLATSTTTSDATTPGNGRASVTASAAGRASFSRALMAATDELPPVLRARAGQPQRHGSVRSASDASRAPPSRTLTAVAAASLRPSTDLSVSVHSQRASRGVASSSSRIGAHSGGPSAGTPTAASVRDERIRQLQQLYGMGDADAPAMQASSQSHTVAPSLHTASVHPTSGAVPLAPPHTQTPSANAVSVAPAPAVYASSPSTTDPVHAPHAPWTWTPWMQPAYAYPYPPPAGVVPYMYAPWPMPMLDGGAAPAPAFVPAYTQSHTHTHTHTHAHTYTDVPVAAAPPPAAGAALHLASDPAPTAAPVLRGVDHFAHVFKHAAAHTHTHTHTDTHAQHSPPSDSTPPAAGVRRSSISSTSASEVDEEALAHVLDWLRHARPGTSGSRV